jgi:hypothetical protein
MIIRLYLKFFIKQIFRVTEKAPFSPASSTVLCRGWDNSGSFQPEAVSLVMALKVVSIMVKVKCTEQKTLLCGEREYFRFFFIFS